GFIDGAIQIKVGGNLNIVGGTGSSDERFRFAQVGHSLASAVGGFNDSVTGYLERDGRIVGEAEIHHGTNYWVLRPEGYYPTGWTGDPAPPPATFSGSRNGWFMELPDGQPVGSPGAGDGSYLLYSFTTGSDGGNYRLYTNAAGFNGNSDSLYVDILEIKDGVGSGEADWYFMGTVGTGVFTWNTGNAGFEHTSATTGAPATWN